MIPSTARESTFLARLDRHREPPTIRLDRSLITEIERGGLRPALRSRQTGAHRAANSAEPVSIPCLDGIGEAAPAMIATLRSDWLPSQHRGDTHGRHPSAILKNVAVSAFNR